MNNHIAKLQATATNPSTNPGLRDKVLARLKQISVDGNDKRHAEAGRVLRELIGQAPNVTPLGDDSDNPEAPTLTTDSDWGPLGNLSVGPAPETKISGRLASLIAEAERETCKSNVYRYILPAVYREFVKGSPFVVGDLSRAAAKALLDRFLPCKWLTRELFEEIEDKTAPDPSKDCFSQEPVTVRAAAYFPKWRAAKLAWEKTNGPARINLCDILFDPETDFMVSAQKAGV